jgi:hypothetical protein
MDGGIEWINGSMVKWKIIRIISRVSTIGAEYRIWRLVSEDSEEIR